MTRTATKVLKEWALYSDCLPLYQLKLNHLGRLYLGDWTPFNNQLIADLCVGLFVVVYLTTLIFSLALTVRTSFRIEIFSFQHGPSLLKYIGVFVFLQVPAERR